MVLLHSGYQIFARAFHSWTGRGRGIDPDRNSANIQDGSFRADAFKKHKHLITDVHPYDGFALLGGGFDGGGNSFKWRKNETFDIGGYETRPKHCINPLYKILRWIPRILKIRSIKTLKTIRQGILPPKTKRGII